MILTFINLKDHHALVQQVKVLRRIQQIVKLAALVIRVQHIQEIIHVEIARLNLTIFQNL